MERVLVPINANVRRDGRDMIAQNLYVIKIVNIMVTAHYQTHALVKRDGLALIALNHCVLRTVTTVDNAWLQILANASNGKTHGGTEGFMVECPSIRLQKVIHK